MLSTTKTKYQKGVVSMNSIASEAHFRQRVLKYSIKKGVTEASRRYHVSRQAIYEWRARYDGTWKSLKEKSHRPHHHPNEHTDEEIRMIKNYKANNKETGLVTLWVKLRRAGYTRTIQGLYHVMVKLGIYEKVPSKRKDKNGGYYEQPTYPGEKVQIDVKYVPKKCLSKDLQEQGVRYYQYTAIDEYTRKRYLWYTDEHSTYTSTIFVKRLVKYF